MGHGEPRSERNLKFEAFSLGLFAILLGHTCSVYFGKAFGNSSFAGKSSLS